MHNHSARYSPYVAGASAMSSSETACRVLACRVIDQALRDLASPSAKSEDQLSARTFLAGSSMLHHWCRVAQVDPSCIVVRARQVLEGCRLGTNVKCENELVDKNDREKRSNPRAATSS